MSSLNTNHISFEEKLNRLTTKGVIIAFIGRSRHGKDTAADILELKYNFIRRAFATILKEICRLLFDFSEDQLYGKSKDLIDERWNFSPRKTFQFIGTDLIRKYMYKLNPDIGEKFWVIRLEMYLRKIQRENPEQNIVIPDVRFQNEADMIKNSGGYLIKVVRPSLIKPNNNIWFVNIIKKFLPQFVKSYLGIHEDHVSESNIDNMYGFDYTIVNDGTINELHKKVEDIMRIIKEKQKSEDN